MQGENARVRALDAATVCAVKDCVKREGSLRKAAKVLGVSHGVVAHIVNERGQHVSLEKENSIRLTLTLPALPPTVSIPVCPDCHGVHHGRCHGKEVALRTVSQRVYTRVWAMPTSQLARAIREREPYG